MPITSRREGDAILVDSVDLKRSARNLLRLLEQTDWTPPKDLNQAMDLMARSLSYPNLHAVQAESLRGSSPVFPSAATTDGTGGFDASPYRIHPLVSSGDARPSAQDRIAAETLIAGLTTVLVQLTSGCDVLVTGETAWDFLELDFIENFAHVDRDLFPSVDPAYVNSLQRYLRSLPGWKRECYLDHSISVYDAHRSVISLISVAPDHWSFGGGGRTPYKQVVESRQAKVSSAKASSPRVRRKS